MVNDLNMHWYFWLNTPSAKNLSDVCRRELWRKNKPLVLAEGYGKLEKNDQKRLFLRYFCDKNRNDYE